jgi:hypothetical protein
MEANEDAETMNATSDVTNIRQEFHDLLMKANKDRPNKTHLEALKDLLYNNKDLELWKTVVGMGELAESQALDTIVNGSGQGMRECWRQRLQAMRSDLGYTESSSLERLLIQQVTLCWLNLNITEYRHTLTRPGAANRRLANFDSYESLVSDSKSPRSPHRKCSNKIEVAENDSTQVRSR